MLTEETIAFDRRHQDATVLTHYLARRRAQLRLSRAQAAELSGLDESVWERLETGWVPEEWEVQRAIARAVQCDVCQIALLALFASGAQRAA